MEAFTRGLFEVHNIQKGINDLLEETGIEDGRDMIDLIIVPSYLGEGETNRGRNGTGYLVVLLVK